MWEVSSLSVLGHSDSTVASQCTDQIKKLDSRRYHFQNALSPRFVMSSRKTLKLMRKASCGYQRRFQWVLSVRVTFFIPTLRNLFLYVCLICHIQHALCLARSKKKKKKFLSFVYSGNVQPFCEYTFVLFPCLSQQLLLIIQKKVQQVRLLPLAS